MQYHRALLIGFSALALVAGVARNASAHHEAWILKNAGASCAFETPNVDGLDNYSLYLFNGSASSRWMTCPVALSARWGSSNGTPYPPTRWARAYSAIVYGVNQSPGSTFSCMARAFLASNVQRFSRTVSTTAGGDFKLTPAFTNSSGVSDWGGSLEADEGQNLKALDFQCNVPGNWSGVYAHKARICVRNPNCGDNSQADGEGWTVSADGSSEDIQTSGIECMAYNDPNIERGHFGIRNNGTGYSSVICPITPSADDTNDPKGRRLTSTVHYRAGGPFGSDPPPTCQFFTRNRGPGLPAGEELWSSAFDHANFDDKFVRRIGFDIGSDRNDIALGVFCELGPGVTLQGITTSMSVAPVSAGF